VQYLSSKASYLSVLSFSSSASGRIVFRFTKEATSWLALRLSSTAGAVFVGAHVLSKFHNQSSALRFWIWSDSRPSVLRDFYKRIMTDHRRVIERISATTTLI
jgi:hypothetical protein